jgi:hypothetical protein
MNRNLFTVLTATVLIAVGSLVARAQLTSIELINTTATWDHPSEEYFPNVFDLVHSKELRFEGIATVGGSPSGPLPATLWLQFDWLDPVLGVQYSPAWGFSVSYTPTLTPIDVSYTLPFCPSQVSLHFATDTPAGGVVNIAGDFTHTCIPEPEAYALVGALGMLGFALWRRRTALPHSCAASSLTASR